MSNTAVTGSVASEMPALTMKTTHVIPFAAVASCLLLNGFAADATTTMVWDFSTPDNPSVIQPASANPFNAYGTATIVPGLGGEGYSSGVFLNNSALYGTATGLLDLLNGNVTLGLDQLAGTPTGTLDYTLVIRQFISNPPGFPYPPTLQFSIAGVNLVSQTRQETAAVGSWYLSTYSWDNVAVSGPVTLTLSTDPNRNLLLDSLSFSVIGDLVPIPEPSVAQLGGLAVLMLGLGTLRRKKSVA